MFEERQHGVHGLAVPLGRGRFAQAHDAVLVREFDKGHAKRITPPVPSRAQAAGDRPAMGQGEVVAPDAKLHAPQGKDKAPADATPELGRRRVGSGGRPGYNRGEPDDRRRGPASRPRQPRPNPVMLPKWPRLRRVLRVTALLVGAGMLVLVHGWRHGFEALPEPAALASPFPALPQPGEPPAPGGFWHAVRSMTETDPHLAVEASRTVLRPRPRQLPRPPEGSRHATGLSLPDPGLAPEQRLPWLEHHPEIGAALEAALAATDLQPPADLLPGDVVAFKLLGVAVAWRAEAAELAGDPATAFRRYVEAWKFQAAAAPPAEFPELFDERRGEEVNELLARPCRRLALTGPGLDAGEARKVLAELAAVGRAAGRPERAFLRAVARESRRLQAARAPDWSRLGRSLHMAGMLVRQDVGRLAMDLLDRTLGRRYRGEPNYHGGAHGVRPLTELLVALQTLVARPADFVAMESAALSRTVAALREGHLPPRANAPPWLPDPLSSRSGWRRWLDRPAVWRLTEVLPDPRTPLESWQHWQVYLESCRITLALRAHRDRHRRWPARLEELVPEFLEAVPRDPFGGAPFRYECTPEGWRFWSAGPAGRDPEREDAEAVPQCCFRSNEFLDRPGTATPDQGTTRTPSRVR